MNDRPIAFGVNLNNREPLIAPDYDVAMLLEPTLPVFGRREKVQRRTAAAERIAGAVDHARDRDR